MALFSFPLVSSDITEPLPLINTLKDEATIDTQTLGGVTGPDLSFPQLDLSDLIEMLEQGGEEDGAVGTVQRLQIDHQPENNMMLGTNLEISDGCFWREWPTFSDAAGEYK